MIVIKKQDRISYIIDGVSDFYGVTISELKKKTRNQERMNRKRMTMLILYDIADLSLKDIASCMDYKAICLPTIHVHISVIRDLIDSSKECRVQYKELLAFLELN